MNEDGIYRALKGCIVDNPQALEVFKRREHLTSPEQVENELRRISRDIGNHIGPAGALMDNFKTPEQVYKKMYQVFFEGMEGDVKDDKLRAEIAEQAANKYVETIKQKNPHHNEQSVTLLRDEIRAKVNDSIDESKRNVGAVLAGRLGPKVQDSAVNLDALKGPLSDALTAVYAKPGFGQEKPDQQRAEIRAAALQTVKDHISEIVPLDKTMANSPSKVNTTISGIAGKLGLPLPGDVTRGVESAEKALQNKIENAIAIAIADQVANKAVPGGAPTQSTGRTMMAAARSVDGLVNPGSLGNTDPARMAFSEAAAGLLPSPKVANGPAAGFTRSPGIGQS